MNAMKNTFAVRLSALVSLLGLCAGNLFASDNGVSGAAFLNNDVGGRQTAMSGAFTPLADDLFGMRYNPAALGRMTSAQAAGMYQKGMFDTKMQFLGFAMPVPFLPIEAGGATAAGLTVQLSQNGDMDYYSLKSDGSADKNGVSVSAGSDLAVTLGAGTYLGSLGMGKYGDSDHYLGASAKLISSKLPSSATTDVKATTYAADLGYLARARRYNLNFGAALTNMGGELKYVSEGTPLPSTARVGLAYDNPLLTRDIGFVFALDGQHMLKDKYTSIRLGTEFSYARMFSLRGGYRFGEYGGVSLGAGITVNAITADFGLSFRSELENTVQFSLAYRFPIAQATPSSRRRSSSYQRYQPKDKNLMLMENGGEELAEPVAQPKVKKKRSVTLPEDEEQPKPQKKPARKTKKPAAETSSGDLLLLD